MTNKPSSNSISIFELNQVSSNVYSILEKDTLGCNPLCYLVFGSEDKVLLVDTGCGCGNLYFFLRNHEIMKDKRITVINTHNHPEQVGGNWRFSTSGRYGLAHSVDALCASKRHKYYTRLMDSNWHWQIETYKITRWLNDAETILLGPESDSMNIVQVRWTPGHTPDSLVLWYPYDKRLFVGDLFYRFDDLLFTHKYTNIREYEHSFRQILQFVQQQPNPSEIRYSASKNDADHSCLPVFKHFHRFLLAVLAGSHPGVPLRIDEAEGSRYETRDRSMRLVLGRHIVKSLIDAREKAMRIKS